MRKVWDQSCFKSDMVHCSCKDGGKTFVPSVFPVSNDIVAAMVINFVVQILWQNVQAISACFALAKQLACNSDNNKVVMWVTSCMSITTSAWDEDTNNWLSKQHNPSLINQFLVQRVLTFVDSCINVDACIEANILAWLFSRFTSAPNFNSYGEWSVL